jgi:hypothetical protein
LHIGAEQARGLTGPEPVFERACPLGASAADLKFLQRLPQAHLGTSNRKAALAV